MNTILALLQALTKEEQQEFQLFLKRKNRRGDTKNLFLLKLLESGKTENLDIALYGKPAKNAYHALCKRLQDSLIDFIASKGLAQESSEELDLLKLLLASRIFFERKQHKVAFKTLEKAEKNAQLIDVHPILNEIYHTKIQYAHLNPRWHLTEIVKAADENMHRLQQESHLNMAYASIKLQLKQEKHKTIDAIISEAFSNFHIEINETMTYKSLFQLMEVTATAAKLQSDYHTIAPFMTTIYDIIRKKGAIADKHRYYHISILNLMALSNFRNKQFDQCQRFIQEMETEMEKGRRAFYNRFVEKLCVLKALRLNYTGKAKEALEVLQLFKGTSLDIALIHLMCLFQQEQFQEAYTKLQLLNHTDDWYEKKTGWQWVLKKGLIEILLLIELDKLDLVLLKVQRFKRRFTKPLKRLGEERVLTFMELILQYYEQPTLGHSDHFKTVVERSFTWIGREKEDVFVMSFYAWLKSKMEGKNLYQTTLELVRGT